MQTFKCNGIEGQSWQRGGCTIAPTGQSSPVLIGACCQGNNAFLGNVHVGIKANGYYDKPFLCWYYDDDDDYGDGSGGDNDNDDDDGKS